MTGKIEGSKKQLDFDSKKYWEQRPKGNHLYQINYKCGCIFEEKLSQKKALEISKHAKVMLIK